ncbi:hypothetical protein MKX03_037931 [Papaver bracteatum]|nr:hypothetical protein MKX03_037931 [Papaver bracteatum]
MFDFTKTERYLSLKADKERRRLRRAQVGKNSDTDTTNDNWIDMYFINLTARLEYHKKQLIYPRFEIKESSIDLESSLKMFFQEAACDADDWTDVNRMVDDRRSFHAFVVFQIAPSGLDKYASNEDNDINIGYQPNTWSFSEASPDDEEKYYDGSLNSMKFPQRILGESDRSLKLMLMKPSQTYAMVVTDKYNEGSLSLEKLLRDNVQLLHDIVIARGGCLWLEKLVLDVCIADKWYNGSLLLKELLQRIRSQSGDDFRREQAGLLEYFLDHLIKIQQEQRFVANSFSDHLEQLRKSVFYSNAVDDDGDRHTCPLILPKHTVDYYIWRQKHLFDSLCTMSRESVWLLKTLKDSPFSSPSSIKESNKILDVILAFISKFKKSKDLLDQYLHDESFRRYVDPDRLVMYTKEKLDAFGWHVKHLQQQGVERKSVAEMLLGCFLNVVNMNFKRGNLLDKPDNPLRREAAKKTSELPRKHQCTFSKAAKRTSDLINEAVEKLNSVKCSDLYSGGSPLGCIALWRILFESSLINLRLDLICKNHGETVKLEATDDQLDEITLSIDKLLAVGGSVLSEFIAMHKMVAGVSYMLVDAFTTGGAAMRGLRPENFDPENFNLDDFPWDKHNVRTRIGDTRPKYCEEYDYDV